MVGAGPTGLACAIEAEKAGFKALIIDKGCLVNSLLSLSNQHGLLYDAGAAGDRRHSVHYRLLRNLRALKRSNITAGWQSIIQFHVRQYEWVKTITGEDGKFCVTTTDRHGAIHDYRARKIVVATGYYDLANQLKIPGEDLEKVFHYYKEPHPYYDTDVVVIGGKNSAAEAALDLWRHGARVTLVHRGEQMHHHVKYWVRPDIENRIKAGEIARPFQEQRAGDRP